MGTCGQPGYVFRDFCLEQGIEFIIFCLNQGIDLSIFVLNWVKCLKQGIKNRNSVLIKMGRKISDICLKQGQGMRGRAAPPQPGIHQVPPPGLQTACPMIYLLNCDLTLQPVVSRAFLYSYSAVVN